ncbi:MAG: 3-isopropylmalate dehydratase [Thermodesulfobacteriota bacterium]
MEAVHTGHVIKLGDDIDTDIIIPTQYLTLRTIRDMVPYAFSPRRPEIPSLVRRGDILVCGKNFGCGSSREHAPEILKELGLFCVVAKSFARIFYRNAINNGLLVIENSLLYERVQEGDPVTVDLRQCSFMVKQERIRFGAIPTKLLDMIDQGGLVSYWKQRNKK